MEAFKRLGKAFGRLVEAFGRPWRRLDALGRRLDALWRRLNALGRRLDAPGGVWTPCIYFFQCRLRGSVVLYAQNDALNESLEQRK